jgi:hypothetical protein
LVEQLETRLQSVKNEEDYFRKTGRPIDMPKGAAFFRNDRGVGGLRHAFPRLLIAFNVLLLP